MTRPRAPRPRSKCSTCGTETQSLNGVCRSCQEAALNTERRRGTCIQCGTRCRSTSGKCADCVAAAPKALTGGRWTVVRGVQRWVPDPLTARQQRLRRLLDERHDQRWWTAPLREDDEQVTRRRLAAMVAEFDEFDQRVKEAS